MKLQVLPLFSKHCHAASLTGFSQSFVYCCSTVIK